MCCGIKEYTEYTAINRILIHGESEFKQKNNHTELSLQQKKQITES